MNYIRHLNAAFLRIADDERLATNHYSLYMALFYLWNENKFKNPFMIFREELMQLSKIRNANTYTNCIKDLHSWAYIVYMPSKSRHQASKVEMIDFTACTFTNIDKSNDTDNLNNIHSTLSNSDKSADKGNRKDAGKDRMTYLSNTDKEKEINQTLIKDINISPTENFPEENPATSIFQKEVNHSSKSKEKVALKRNVSSAELKVADSSKIPIPEILFSQSEFADKDKFKAAFENTDYAHVNLDYYYAAVMNWSEGKQARRKDWIATARQFMLSDFRDGKLVITNATAHGKTNHTNGKSPSAKSTDAGVNLDAIFAVIDYTHSQKQ